MSFWLLFLGCGSEVNLVVDFDEDGISVPADCNDADPEVNPEAVERCNGLDDDCDGLVDDEDDDLAEGEGDRWYLDADGDGHGDPDSSRVGCAAMLDEVATGDDCDDRRGDVHPGSNEFCDGVDEDCDKTIDEDAVDAAPWFVDADGDGVGTAIVAGIACEAPAADVAAVSGDCDDDNADIHPGAVEVCSGADEDCDGLTDDDDPSVDQSSYSAWPIDADGDGAGGDQTGSACAPTAPMVLLADDCDDANPSIWPGADERCNGFDDDCDGLVDDDDTNILVNSQTVYFSDRDSDGFGDVRFEVPRCDPLLGLTLDSTDCDDTQDTVHPDAVERCDQRDNDCDGRIDDDDVVLEGPSAWTDSDGDGFGDDSTVAIKCRLTTGLVRLSGDCDDAAPEVSPDASEICNNNIDDNCDDSPAPCGAYGENGPSFASAMPGYDWSLLGTELFGIEDVDGDGRSDLFSAKRPSVSLIGDAGLGLLGFTELPMIKGRGVATDLNNDDEQELLLPVETATGTRGILVTPREGALAADGAARRWLDGDDVPEATLWATTALSCAVGQSSAADGLLFRVEPAFSQCSNYANSWRVASPIGTLADPFLANGATIEVSVPWAGQHWEALSPFQDNDGDGATDFAVTTWEASSNYRLLYRPGPFSGRLTIPRNAPHDATLVNSGGAASAIGWGDFDGDGRLELLGKATGRPTGSPDLVSVAETVDFGVATGSAPETTALIVFDRVVDTLDIEVADFDGDTISDVALVLQEGPDTTALYLLHGPFDGRVELHNTHTGSADWPGITSGFGFPVTAARLATAPDSEGIGQELWGFGYEDDRPLFQLPGGGL